MISPTAEVAETPVNGTPSPMLIEPVLAVACWPVGI